MNVRFFAGSKQQYLALTEYSPLALYFCYDTRELFWGDLLLSDGMRVVATYKELPSFDLAADGVIYFVTETRNGYVLSNDRTEWIQTIWAPGNSGNGGGQSADLSNYYSKAEVDAAISSAIAQIKIPDVEGFLKDIPAEYITETELAAKGYLTEHQSLEGYATEEFVENAIANIELPELDDVNLDNYATKQWVEDKGYLTAHQDLSGKADVDHTHDDLYEAKGAAEAVKNELLNGAGDAYDTLKELSDLIIDNKGTIDALTELAANKADKEHEHSKYLTEHQPLDEYAKKAELFSKDYNDLSNKPEIPSVAGLASEQFVKDEIAKLPEVDLTGYAKTDDIPSLEGYAKTEDIPTDYLTNADLSGYSKFSGSYSDLTDKPEIPSVAGLASEDYVDNAVKNVTVDTSNLVTLEQLATKANEVLFTRSKVVKTSVGGFAIDDDLKGLTIAQLFAKLLGFSDEDVVEPETPAEPNGIVETILANRTPMYAITSAGVLEEIPYKLLNYTTTTAKNEPVESGFYQIKDADGTVIESGYQELQANSDETYYIIALPKAIDYSTMITIRVYSAATGTWMPYEKFNFTCEPTEVASICADVDVDISNIDESLYTVWAVEECPTGSKLRFIITE